MSGFIRYVDRIGIGIAVLCLAATAFAQGAPAKKEAPPPPPPAKKTAPAPAHVFMQAADFKWGPGPAALPAGAQLAVLHGDPAGTGAFMISAKMPDGYTVPPHWHPTDENIVVMQGSLILGMGDKLDEAAGTAITAGGYARMPARMHHFAKARGATTIIISGMGPFEVTYINPKDDPRNAAKK